MEQSFDFNNFMAKYVTTNVATDAKAFDQPFLLDMLKELNSINANFSNGRLNFQLLVAMCCAQKRADLIPSIFKALFVSESHTSDDILEVFGEVRETVNIIWPFVGIPQVIPCCLGLSGLLMSLGTNSVECARTRSDFGPADTELGTQTRKAVYKASANGEVFDMLETYFGDLAYLTNGIAFGYNLGRASQTIFSLPESELILTTAIIALGATRQAGSHIKACAGFGVSETDMELVVRIVMKFADWQGSSIPDICVSVLYEQAELALHLENVGVDI